MLYKENCKVFIVMRFLWHQIIDSKFFKSMLYWDRILIRVIDVDTFYFIFCDKKQLTHLRISFREITCLYGKPHVIFV